MSPGGTVPSTSRSEVFSGCTSAVSLGPSLSVFTAHEKTTTSIKPHARKKSIGPAQRIHASATSNKQCSSLGLPKVNPKSIIINKVVENGSRCERRVYSVLGCDTRTREAKSWPNDAFVFW